MTPDASSLSQYDEYQQIPIGPDLAPRRINPFRASRFKSSFRPSCKHTRSRGLDIVSLNLRRADFAAGLRTPQWRWPIELRAIPAYQSALESMELTTVIVCQARTLYLVSIGVLLIGPRGLDFGPLRSL